MTVIVYILIGLVALLTILIGYTVIRDEVKQKKEEKKAKQESQAPTQEPPAPVNKSKNPEPIPDDHHQEKIGNLVSPSDVAFDVKRETLEEKYLALPGDIRGYYDEIVKAANAIEGSKRLKNENYEDYKLGKNRLVRLKIRRGALVAELIIPNLSFKTYQSGGAALKQAPITVKVVDEASLNAVKEGIAYTLKAIEDEKAYKKELARERRRKSKEEKQKSE